MADRKVAYGLFEDIAGTSSGSSTSSTGSSRPDRVPRAPAQGLKTSSNGKVLYIYVAGTRSNLYDAVPYHLHARRFHARRRLITELFVFPNTPSRCRAAQDNKTPWDTVFLVVVPWFD